MKVNGEMLDKLYKVIKDRHVLETVIILLSILSVNFSSYISYFDLNTISIIDSTSISKYFFGAVVLYAIVAACVSILLLFVQNLILIISEIPLVLGHEVLGSVVISKESRKNIQVGLEGRVIKYLLILMTFCFLYIGFMATFLIFFLCLLYISVISYFRKKFADEGQMRVDVEQSNEKFKIDSSIYNGVIPGGFLVNFLVDFLIDAITDIKKGKYSDFIISKVGVLLLLFAFSLGIGRAFFVEENIHVNLNGGEKILVLYLTTNDGVALYDKGVGQVSFTSWGNISDLVFVGGKRRSIIPNSKEVFEEQL
jgi:hypothetical protein